MSHYHDRFRKLACQDLRSGDASAVHDWQEAQLNERRSSDVISVEICGIQLDVFRGVYNGGGDTELMIDSAVVTPSDTFLEVGCGSGAISIHLARKAKFGMGVDVNPAAVANSRHNANRLGIQNVEFRQGDVFGDVVDRFDVVLFNPPFTSHPAQDYSERMFWDPSDHAKQSFFSGVTSRLRSGGRVYFGWASLDSLDSQLPVRLAEANGLCIAKTHSCTARSGLYQRQVLEFAQKN